jgi:hypothetical protein
MLIFPKLLVARDGIELPTRGFSVLPLYNDINKLRHLALQNIPIFTLLGGLLHPICTRLERT